MNFDNFRHMCHYNYHDKNHYMNSYSHHGNYPYNCYNILLDMFLCIGRNKLSSDWMALHHNNLPCIPCELFLVPLQ